MDGFGHMYGWGGGWTWLWGTLMMTLWVVIIVAVVWWLVRTATGSRPHDRAREILAERYASGDLTTEEYHERLRALK